jgi:hypothetical protein
MIEHMNSKLVDFVYFVFINPSQVFYFVLYKKKKNATRLFNDKRCNLNFYCYMITFLTNYDKTIMAD